MRIVREALYHPTILDAAPVEVRIFLPYMRNRARSARVRMTLRPVEIAKYGRLMWEGSMFQTPLG